MPLNVFPDKAQAIHNFWSSFEWPAYDENTVPDDAKDTYPRITYNVQTDSLGNSLALYGSLWDYGTSWERLSKKSYEIEEAVYRMFPSGIPIDVGRLHLTPGTPFAQRMSDENDMVRRIYINITAEFFSTY